MPYKIDMKYWTGQNYYPTNQWGNAYTPYLPTVEDDSENEFVNPLDNWDYATAQEGPNGEQLPPLAFGWRPDGTADFGDGINGWLKGKLSDIETAWMTGLDDGMNSGGHKIKVDQTGKPILDENGNETWEPTTGAYFSAAVKMTMQTGQEMVGALLDAMALPALATERAGGTLGLALRDVQRGEEIDWKENFEASRLAYAGMFNTTVEAEFKRRLAEGDRAEIIAEDMQVKKQASPWAEFFGQLIFDPLNADILLDVAGKGRKGVQLTRQFTEHFHTVGDNVAMGIEKIRAGGMTEAAAADTLRELMTSKRQLAGKTEEFFGKLVTPKVSYGFKGFGKVTERQKQIAMLTSASKTKYYGNIVSEIAQHVAANVDEADDVLEIFRAMHKSLYGTEDEAMEAISTLTKFRDPVSLFSNAGDEATVVIANMFEMHGEKWLDDLAEASAKGTDEVVRVFGEKMDSTLKQLFPSVEDMYKAKEAVAAGETAENVVKLAKSYDDLPQMYKNISRLDSKLQKGIVGTLNRGFASLYMGWNPGFGIRNAVQNNVQIFLDYGPKALGQSVAGLVQDIPTVLDEAQKLHGASLFGAEGFTKSAEAAGAGKKAPIAALSNYVENKAAQTVIGHTYQKTFKGALQPMARDISKKFSGKLPKELLDRLPEYIMDAYGDVDGALNMMRKDAGAGYQNLFKMGVDLPKEISDFLQPLGQSTALGDVLKAGTKDDALAKVDDIFNALGEYAKKAAGDTVYAADAADQVLLKASDDGAITHTSAQLITAKKQAASAAIAQAQQIINNTFTAINELSVKTGQPIDVTKLLKDYGIDTVAQWGKGFSEKATALVNVSWEATRSGRPEKFWDRLNDLSDGMFGVMPAGMSEQTFKDLIWKNYREFTSKGWDATSAKALQNSKGYLDELAKLGVKIPPEDLKNLDEAMKTLEEVKSWAIGKGGFIVRDSGDAASRATKIADIAAQYGIPTASVSGAPTDKHTLAIINKYAGVKYGSLDEVPLEIARQAFAKKAGAKLETIAEELPKVILPYNQQSAPSLARLLNDSQLDVAKKMLTDYVENNFGRIRTMAVDTAAEKAIGELSPLLKERLAEIRLMSSRVAQESRNFTLLNYGMKTYWDSALAYIYPYQFWYSRTYSNWLNRAVTNPATLAGYAKYKKAMAEYHAGLPEWWKYNINTDELFGIDTGNPMFFNLEAALWPLNGLTNTDFNDPYKRVNWWTSALDAANTMGPSTWAPINIVTGLALYAKGETEAGERWMGRLIPQTATIKAGASLMGVDNLELDPFVKFLQGGLDPYERRRVSRGLSAMMQEGKITEAQAIDAARTQQGAIWDEAVARSIHQRAAPQLSSFLFGVGYKPRTKQDMEIDQFYAKYQRLWAMEPNMAPEEFKMAMDGLHDQYKFMDAMLLSRRGGIERDRGLAYNVVGRIPPGASKDMLEFAGINQEMLDKFYSDKGRIDKWSESDSKRFMSGIVALSAVLDIPKTPVRQEWTAAKLAYSQMSKNAEDVFGKDIWGKVDEYYRNKRISYEAGNDFLAKNPVVSQVLDWKSQQVLSNRLLTAYYGGIDTLEGYYKSTMYDDLEKKFPNINDTLDQYYYLNTYGNVNDAKKFYKLHPEIGKYYDAKDVWQIQINRLLAEFGDKLPQGQGALIRPDADVQSLTTQGIIQGMQSQQQQQPSWQQWQQVLSPELQGLVLDYYNNGQPLPAQAERMLGRMATDYGYGDWNELLQVIGQSLY